jgi:Phosphotransferase enzyme family
VLALGPEAGRHRRALEAATSIAGTYGVPCRDAYVLKDSNNTIVHLAPSAIVAKVDTTTICEDHDALRRELEIGAHLARNAAPIAPPASEIPPGPYSHNAVTVTFWRFLQEQPQRPISHNELAAALGRFHDAFANYTGRLAGFIDIVDRAAGVIADPSRTPQLKRADRSILKAAYERIARRLRDLPIPAVTPLHGDPHLDGNVLVTPDGPVFIDFEGACTGPREWDLTALPGEVAKSYPGIDIALVDQLREARSLCVAAWCWTQPERAPEVKEAAHFHLNLLRRSDVDSA